jgi:hypothetical protein
MVDEHDSRSMKWFGKNHAMGLVDPRSGNVFDEKANTTLNSYLTHNVLHRSTLIPDEVKDYGLPTGRTSIEHCTVQELRAIINARDGNTVLENGQVMNKATLLKTIKAYINLEVSAPCLVQPYDKNPATSGTYLKDLDMAHSATIHHHFIQILGTPFVNREVNRALKVELETAHVLWKEKKFIEDFEEIALESPELRPELIYKRFGHIGESMSSKNIGVALQRTLGMEKLIFHAIAASHDKSKLYLLSKQEASYSKDEKTRSKVEHGERPEFKQYLLFLVLEVEPTGAKYGHTLGKIVDICHAYCAYCTAGLGNCYHCVKALWLQYHHWGEDRKTQRPVTMDFCTWLQAKRNSHNSMDAIWEVGPMRLPTSIEEAEKRSKRPVYRNSTSGVCGNFTASDHNEARSAPRKDPKLFDITYNPHLSKLFKSLRK